MVAKVYLREKIKVYSKFGGLWEGLKDDLVAYGMSNKFASEYIDIIRKNLSDKNSQKALEVFDYWDKVQDENVAMSHAVLIN